MRHAPLIAVQFQNAGAFNHRCTHPCNLIGGGRELFGCLGLLAAAPIFIAEAYVQEALRFGVVIAPNKSFNVCRHFVPPCDAAAPRALTSVLGVSSSKHSI